MPSKKSLEIDYAGNEVRKYLERSKNPNKIVSDVLEKSGHTKDKDGDGFIKFSFKKNEHQTITLNLFIKNITYDISHKDSIKKITTGRKGNPFKTSRNDSETIKTFLIGVYVFNKYDDYKKAILVSFPIVEDIKYESNSSLSFSNELIKKTRLSDDPQEEFNTKKRKFIGFKPLHFGHNFNSIYNVNKSENQKKIISQKYIEYNFNRKLKPKKITSKTDYHELIIGIIIGGYGGDNISAEIIKDCLERNIITVVDNSDNPQNVHLYPIPEVNKVFENSKKCAEKIIQKASGNGKDVKWTGLYNKDHPKYGAADIVATFDKLGTVGISIKMDTGQLKNDSVNTLFKTLGLEQLNNEYFLKNYSKDWDSMTKDWVTFVEKEFKKKTKDKKALSVFRKHKKLKWNNFQIEKMRQEEMDILMDAVGMGKLDKSDFKYFCHKMNNHFYPRKNYPGWKTKRKKHFNNIFKDFGSEYDIKIKYRLMDLFQRQLSMCNNINTLYVAEKGNTFWFIPSKKNWNKKLGEKYFFSKYRSQPSSSGYEFIIDAYNKNKDLVGSIIIIIRFANGQMTSFPTTKSRYKLIEDDWTSILGKISDYY